MLQMFDRPAGPHRAAGRVGHLIEFTRAAGRRETLRYEHRRASTDLALAIPDAIAWCWAKGGDWRRRIEPVVTNVREV